MILIKTKRWIEKLITSSYRRQKVAMTAMVLLSETPCIYLKSKSQNFGFSQISSDFFDIENMTIALI